MFLGVRTGKARAKFTSLVDETSSIDSSCFFFSFHTPSISYSTSALVFSIVSVREREKREEMGTGEES